MLAFAHVYYSDCWVPSKNCYHKLDRLLRDFIWALDKNKNELHRVSWDICCLPRVDGGMDVFNCNHQGFALCAKWILSALQGNEAWKILIRYCLSTSLPLGKREWKALNLHIVLTILVQFNMYGSFIVKSIWKAWEALKY